MRTIYAVLLPLALAFLNSSHASVPPAECLPEAGKPEIVEPDRIIHRYLRAVERGELVVFGRKLDRTMIVPIHVEYVYVLASRTTTVKVYAELREPLPVPGRRSCQVHGVDATLVNGRITETESHIRMNE